MKSILISGYPAIHKTRFKILGYWHMTGTGFSFWQCVDLTGDRPAQVGHQYATEKELLANLESYATEYGCEEANPRPSLSNFADGYHADTIALLRAKGYAVIIWTPEELAGASRNRVEDRLVELGWEVIADLKPESDDEDTDETCPKCGEKGVPFGAACHMVDDDDLKDS
jgi:hypothetical protein